MKCLVALLVVFAAVAVVADTEQLTAEQQEKIRADIKAEMKLTHPIRQGRGPAPLADGDLEERANLLFRALDHNADQRLTATDVRRSEHALAEHLPGVTVDEFVSFIQQADTDHDGKLTRKELHTALADGIKMNDTSLLETDAKAARVGLFGGIAKFAGKVVGNVVGGIKRFGRKITGKVDKQQDVCVMCQYIVERCETNVKASGVIPTLTSAGAAPQIFLETEAKTEQSPMDFAASSVIGATRQATRYQRQMERTKYNEIYRVVDVTLDDVCEQGMPNTFYKYCKMVYQTQPDIVDGLRYQYRPADICFRVGMCDKDSYITKGVHSRYN